jgi:PAS domain S-box-containing protein
MSGVCNNGRDEDPVVARSRFAPCGFRVETCRQASDCLAEYVDATDDALFSVSLSGHVLSWNRGAELLFGYGPHEIVDRSVGAILELTGPGGMVAKLMQIAEGLTVSCERIAGKDRSGHVLAVTRRMTAIHDPGGAVVGAWCALRPLGQSLDGGFVQTGVDRRRPVTLGKREKQVLHLLAVGQASKQIAYEMGISVRTVETHRRNIMAKLDIHSVAELTKYAVRSGLSTLDE